ncbi:MAG: hypothetical protein LWX83_02680 [Anaerolineae bacterium]|nr:hypothetical protein [Anaerolineae bacterium]
MSDCDNEPRDFELEKLLVKLDEIPARETQAAAQGRERFLAQARELAPGVSEQVKQRHTGCNKNIFERILLYMKTPLRSLTLAGTALLAVVVIFMATSATRVSAQQIMERAVSARDKAAAVVGILHNRIQVYDNPGTDEGAGTTLVIDDYFNLESGFFRRVESDLNGTIQSISGSDGNYSYNLLSSASDGSLKIERYPVSPKPAADDENRAAASISVDDSTRAVYDQFYNNPRVEVEAEKTWTDGSPVYVLINRSYQTQKNGDGQGTLTGTTRMVFNKDTYQLLQVQTSVHKDGKDILIYQCDFLVNEVLPADTSIAWDLSDLKNATVLDAPEPDQEDVKFDTLARQDLIERGAHAYVFSPIPEGYSEDIVAAEGQPENQPYQYEVNYHFGDGKTFGMMAIGALESNFVEKNFYDGSYKTASGLVLYYSPSSRDNFTSAILATPDGEGFLTMVDLPRAEVESLAETLVPLQ